MANLKRRILPLLLAAVMLLGTLPANAFAYRRSDRKEDKAEEKVLTCTNANHHEHTKACYKTEYHKHSRSAGCYRGIFLVCFKGAETKLVCGCEEHNESCYGPAVNAESEKPVDVESVLGGVDYNAFACEIGEMVREKHGDDLDENWCENNRELMEEYIRRSAGSAKCLTEEQRTVILDQIENGKEHAAEIMTGVCTRVRDEIARELSAAKEAAKSAIGKLTSDRALGIKIGKAITKLTGLNNAKASARSGMIQTSLIAAVRLSAMSKTQKETVIAHMKSGEDGMKDIINWLWPIYTVNFVNGDAVLETLTVEHGVTPVYSGATPEKEADVQFTYTFSGWDREIAAAAEDATYAARFEETLNKYAVSFLAEDGETVLWSGEFEYGATPAFGGEKTPVKAEDNSATYEFSGWTPALVSVEGEASYKAVFTTNYKNYTVTFKNYDGKVISEKNDYHYGDTVTVPTEPTRAGYTFTGWDEEVAAVAGDAVYTATFEITKLENVPAYFFGRYLWNGEGGREIENWYHLGTGMFMESVNDPEAKILDETLTVEDIALPATMKTCEYDGTVYSFGAESGKDFYTVEWNRLVIDKGALSQYNSTGIRDGQTYHVDGTLSFFHTVTLNVNGVESTMPVAHGAVMEKPADPGRTGYNFAGWKTETGEDFDLDAPITESVKLTAAWEAKTYKEMPLKVNLGYAAVSASGSTKGNIHLTPNGEFQGKIYNVIANAAAANYPSDTIIGTLDYAVSKYYGYSADGLDPAVMNFTGYSINEGVLDSAEWNGVIYYNATGVAMPEHSDFFRIYRTDFVACKGEYHMDNHASFYHTVTFEGCDYETMFVKHGEKLTLEDPTREGCTFAGWVLGETAYKNGTAVQNSMTLVATWTCTVTFMNEDGTVLQTIEAPCGAEPVYTGAELTKAPTDTHTYEFAGWTPALEPVAAAAEYTAVFTENPRVYKVTLDLNGGKFKTDSNVTEYTYGIGSALPKTSGKDNDDLYRQGYNFVGWTLDGKKMSEISKTQTGDLTLIAQWEAKWNTYDAKIYGTRPDGKAVEFGTGKYGRVMHPTAYENEGRPTAFEPDKLKEVKLNTVKWNGVSYSSDTNALDYYIYKPATAGEYNSKTYRIDGELTFFHTVTFTVDGEVVGTVVVEHGKTVTAPFVADKEFYTFSGWTVNGNAFDVDAPITVSMTLDAGFKAKTHEEKELEIYIGYGKSATDETEDWYEYGVGKIYDVRYCETFGNHPDSTAMAEGDYSGYEVGELGEITIDGVTYQNGTGVENPTGNYYVIKEVVLVACEAEYHMDNHVTLYRTDNAQ